MRSKNILKVAGSGLIAVTLAFGIHAVARADEPLTPATVAVPGLAAADRADLIGRMTGFGITEATQVKLFQDMAAGKRWDADAGTAEPVKSETTKVGDVQYTTMTFPDGSVAQSTIEQPEVVTPPGSRFIQQCQLIRHVRDQKSWQHCKVGWNGLSWHVDYTAAYHIWQFGSIIDSVSGIAYGGTGTFSNGSASITTRQGSGPDISAIARGTAQQCVTNIFCDTVGAELQVRYSWGGGRSSRIMS